MRLVRRSGPVALALTGDEVLAHLRLSSDPTPPDLDDILRITEGVIQEHDGPNGMLRRALVTQEWSAFLDGFAHCIKIPLPPLQEVTAVKYLSPDNTWTTLDPAEYRVIDGGEDRSELIPAHGKSWPATLWAPACVEIQFTCGYAFEGSPPESTLPGDIRNALLEVIALRYSVRDGTAFATDRMLEELPAVKALQRYKVYA